MSRLFMIRPLSRPGFGLESLDWELQIGLLERFGHAVPAAPLASRLPNAAELRDTLTRLPNFRVRYLQLVGQEIALLDPSNGPQLRVTIPAGNSEPLELDCANGNFKMLVEVVEFLSRSFGPMLLYDVESFLVVAPGTKPEIEWEPTDT